MKSLLRTWRTARLDLVHNLRRPLFWIWLLIVVFVCWGFSGGNMRISSGDADVGGTKAFITSEFAIAQILAVLTLLLHAMFVAVGAGMSVLSDEELRVGAVLHATPLGPREYVWGKFLAALASFFVLLAAHVGLMILFNHALTGAKEAEFIGPFVARNYWLPALGFGMPTIVFVAGVTFWLGERSRRPILVFFLPVALLLLCGFFVWDWSPSWLDERWNRLLMWIDPAGLRWLKETFLTVDRGVDYYNTAPITFDTPFLVSRAVFLLIGLVTPALTARHFARSLRGMHAKGGAAALAGAPPAAPERAPLAPAPLAGLGMRAKRPGLLAGLLAVARIEFRELFHSPGLYLFLPLIVLETVGNTSLMRGPFDTPMLMTSGIMAVQATSWLSSLVCLLLLFYTVESLRRETATGIASVHYATPLRTFSLLAGKALANALVGAVVIAVTLLACWVVLLVQGTVAFEPLPFLLVWGAVLLPTYLVWTSFVALVYALVRNRYTTYAIALGIFAWTVYARLTGKLTWRTDWMLSSRALGWSDLGTFELIRWELVLNRALALLVALLFTTLTVKLFPRRGADPTNALLRLRPRPLLLGALRLSPLIVPPLALFLHLGHRIDAGFQGDAAEKMQKDYWRKNVATWTGGRFPDVVGVDVAVDLFPERRAFETKGTFVLENPHDEPLRALALTRGLGWRRPDSLAPAEDETATGPLWTLGDDASPADVQDDAGLVLIQLEEPLAPGARATVGFHYSGEVPRGATKDGGGASEFILPSGIVLTSFSPSFVPVVGYVEGIGVDEDNRYDAKEYAEDFYVGITESGFGGGSAPYPVRTRVSAPEDFRINAVGVLTDEQVVDGRRITQWETDSPVRFFNVVCGHWDVAEGQHGTAIYHHPGHAYNVPEMLEALDGAREHYSEWFYPYPWRDLRISEFPALAGYAQGFPTNITFSEGIGFLTRAEDSDADAPFMVTAHETAHQWWGNILTPGKGPGANLLSEGMAHFSTLLLFEEMRGLRGRIAFAKQIEDQYGEQRQADSERALVWIDGSRPGDTTVTYDKTGWVFWMLLNHMGRDRCLEGLRSFLAHYANDRDHPVLQDFLAHLRPFAPDAEAYDAFTEQWFHEVVVPEFKVRDAAVTQDGDRWHVTARIENVGTGTMPVEVAAASGVRFPDAPADSAAQDSPRDDGTVLAAEGDAPYVEQRTTITLGPGESQEIALDCDFAPERIVVDPDALVLQLRRKQAVHEL